MSAGLDEQGIPLVLGQLADLAPHLPRSARWDWSAAFEFLADYGLVGAATAEADGTPGSQYYAGDEVLVLYLPVVGTLWPRPRVRVHSKSQATLASTDTTGLLDLRTFSHEEAPAYGLGR